MGRSILAVVLGLVLANILSLAIELAGHSVFPPPPGIDLSNPDALRQIVAHMPIGVFLFLLLAWFIGTASGAWLAARLARRAPIVHALVVGGLLLVGAVLSMVMIPHPLWFMVLSVAAIPAAAYLGALLARRQAAPAGAPSVGTKPL